MKKKFTLLTLSIYLEEIDMPIVVNTDFLFGE